MIVKTRIEFLPSRLLRTEETVMKKKEGIYSIQKYMYIDKERIQRNKDGAIECKKSTGDKKKRQRRNKTVAAKESCEGLNYFCKLLYFIRRQRVCTIILIPFFLTVRSSGRPLLLFQFLHFLSSITVSFFISAFCSSLLPVLLTFR